MTDTTSRPPLADILQALQTEYPQRGIVSTAPAAKWDFGTVVGNGVQGALAFCRPRDETLVLSHEEMFLPLFPFAGYLPVRDHYETIRQRVIDGRTDEAQQIVRRAKIEGNFPHYNTTDPFVGAGALDVRMGEPRGWSAYARSVDFETGEALVAWRDAGGLFHRRFFISRADDVLVLRLHSPVGDKVSVTLGLGEIDYEPPTDPRDHDIYAKTIDGCDSSATATHLIHRMRFKHRWDGQPILGSCTAARVVSRGGEVTVSGTQLRVRDADEVLVLLRTVPHRNGESVSADELCESLDAIEPRYDELLAAHAKLHGEMFHRCRLRLSSADRQWRSGEAMQAESSVGDTDPALVEKAFDAARFGIITSTGKLPPALQGVWTGTWKPCWSGDYTLNGNVQSMVAASLCGNHDECQRSLMNYLDSLMDDFRDNARELCGFRGPLIPWRASTHGRTHYLAYKQFHHNFPGIYWFAGAAWFAQIYYDYFLYTGEETFFESRLKPFLLDAVALYEDYLSVERDGEFVLSPSSSPENVIGDDLWMAPNATMTIAAIKQLLRTVLRHAAQLGATDQQVARWQTMLGKLPAYAIGHTGAVKEWAWPGLENEEKHRHASHLYPLWFGVDPEVAASDALREAFKVAIEQRMAPRRKDHGGFMAFGYTQFGMAAAHLGDTAHAYESVEYLVNSYWSPVMVSQHNCEPDGPAVLNMDISGGLPAVVITMLVQSLMPDTDGGPWVVKLLPCLPDAWPTGELTGVRCRGGFAIDITWRAHQLEQLTITADRGGAVTLVLGEQRATLSMTPGEARTLAADELERLAQ